MVDSKFKRLMEFKSSPGDALVNRWHLHKSLSNGMNINYNKNFIKYEENENGVIAYFEDGTSAEGDILIGADGSNSNVRKQLTDKLKVNYIGYANMGGTFNKIMDEKYENLYRLLKNNLVRVLGPNGYSALLLDFKGDDGANQLVWSLSFPYQKDPKDIPFDEVVKIAYGINDVVGEIIKGSGKALLAIRMKSTDTSKEVVLDTTNKVTILGDAAHSMTTQRGLGANTAILDAYDLYNALKGKNWDDSLAKYHTILIARGFKAVNDSFMSTNMIHMKGFKAIIRNYILWTIDKILIIKGYLSSWFNKKN